MADEAIDRLEIQIEAQAKNANAQLDLLVQKLNKVGTSLGFASGQGLSQLANGIDILGNATKNFSANTKTADFTRVAKNLNQMASVNSAGIKNTASAVQSMTAQLGGIKNISFDTTGLTNLSYAIGKLGGVQITQAAANIPILKTQLVSLIQSLNGLQSVNINGTVAMIASLASSVGSLGKKASTVAITNIPLLTSAINSMMITLSKAPLVSQNLIDMTNALANLASQGSKIPSVYNRMTNASNGYSASTSTAAKSSQSLASALGSLYAKCFLLISAFKLLWKSIESATDYIETLNYFEVTVDKVADEAISSWSQSGYDSADSYYNSFRSRMTELTSKFTGFTVGKDSLTMTGSSSLGMDVDDVLNYQATFLQLSDSMGVAEESAYNISSALTMLSADWSSLKNVDLDTSMNKFASALVGQTRAVRSFGIDTLQATLQEYAFKYGIDDTITSMTQAAKVQLRVLALLDQSKVAFGDLANTINQPANQLRVFNAQIANIGRSIGTLFIPLLQRVLPYINGFTMALNRMFIAIGTSMGIDMSSTVTSIGSSTAELEDFTAEEEAATDAAKKLNKQLQGWHELNNISSEKESSKANESTGGYEILDTAIAESLAEYNEAWNTAFTNMENKAVGIADKIVAAFGLIKFPSLSGESFDAIKTSVDNLWISLEPFAANVGQGLKWFYENIVVPYAQTTISETLPALLNTFSEAINTLNITIGLFQSSGSTGVIGDFLKFLQKDYSSGLTDWIVSVGEAFGALGDFINDPSLETSTALQEAILKAFFDFPLLSPTESPLAKILGYIFDIDLGDWFDTNILPWLAPGKWTSLFVGLAKQIPKAWSGITEWFSGLWLGIVTGISTAFSGVVGFFEGIGTSIELAWAGVKEWFSSLLDGIGLLFTTASETVKTTWGAIATWFNENVIIPIQTFFNPIVEWFATLLDSVSLTFSDIFYNIGVIASGCWDIIVVAWSKATTWFETNITDPIGGFFATLWTDISDFASTCWRAIKIAFIVAGTWFSNTVISPVSTFFENLWDDVSGFAITAWDDIKKVFALIGTWINVNVVTPVSGFLSGMWDGFSTAASTAWDGVKEVFGKVGTFFEETFSNAWEGVVKVFSIAGSVFTDIKDGVVKAFTSVVNNLIDGINSVISIPFEGINTALNSIRDISIFGMTPFSGLVSINIPKIPKIDAFENGGLPSIGQYFLARESGPELVGTMGNKSAVANNSQIVDGIASGVYAANSEQNALLREEITWLRRLYEKETGVIIGDADIYNAYERASTNQNNRVLKAY